MNLALRYVGAITLTVCIGFCHTQTLSSHTASATNEIHLSSDESTIIKLTNVERMRLGAAPLKVNSKLMTAARKHSDAMARSNKLTHTLNGKGPAERVLAVGYRYSMVAENISYNQSAPKAVVKSWMASPGHKANILNKGFRETGVGIAYNKKGQPYYTQVFGAR